MCPFVVNIFNQYAVNRIHCFDVCRLINNIPLVKWRNSILTIIAVFPCGHMWSTEPNPLLPLLYACNTNLDINVSNFKCNCTPGGLAQLVEKTQFSEQCLWSCSHGYSSTLWLHSSYLHTLILLSSHGHSSTLWLHSSCLHTLILLSSHGHSSTLWLHSSYLQLAVAACRWLACICTN